MTIRAFHKQRLFRRDLFVRAFIYASVVEVCLIKNYMIIGGPMINIRKNFDAGKIFCAIEAKHGGCV